MVLAALVIESVNIDQNSLNSFEQAIMRTMIVKIEFNAGRQR